MILTTNSFGVTLTCSHGIRDMATDCNPGKLNGYAPEYVNK